jgi:tellurite resistance protein TehA-like permease
MRQIGHSPANRNREAGLLRRRFAGIRFLAAWIRREAVTLHPGCFALVMATGIVSNSLFLQDSRFSSDALLVVGLATYPWLCLLTIWRVAQAGRALLADLLSPVRVFAFFTFVAATDVLGLALDLRGYSLPALLMWFVAVAIWALLIYIGFGVLLFLNARDGADVAGGAWLNAIVGTQSLVILGAHAGLPAGGFGPSVSLLVYMLWAIGLGLYGTYLVLLCHRVFFRDLKPTDTTPVLWIVMGAAAISANAGCALASVDIGLPFLRSMQPFVDGVTLAMWTWATWWIPLLIMLGVWKHGIRQIPISYSLMLWSMVFPLGMYAVTTLRLSRIADVPMLAPWSLAMTWIALGAWSLTAAAFIVASLRRIRMLCWYSSLAFDSSRGALRS